MDALTVSMNRLGTTPEMVALSARAIAVGVLTNTIFKATMAVVVGTGRFRWFVLAGLGLLAAGAIAGLWIGGRVVP
jgi:hypothetical protein